MTSRIISKFVNKHHFSLICKFHYRLFHSTIFKKPYYPINYISDNLHNLQSSFCTNKRYKYKSAKDTDEDDDDDYVSIDVEESELTKASKIINSSVSSMRVDLLLKTGLGISRNKIETAFYESKIRKNGKKVLKKSESVAVGDEIDLISTQTSSNPNFIVVSRLKIIAAKLDVDIYRVRMIRDKNLLVEKENSF